jgi:hypothetical protein
MFLEKLVLASSIILVLVESWGSHLGFMVLLSNIYKNKREYYYGLFSHDFLIR